MVRINVAARCMCVGQDCFRVGIGSSPSMTNNGTGRLGLVGGTYNRRGGRYRTRRRTSRFYDDDAIAMGIPRNDSVGKWIHKPRNCGPAPSSAPPSLSSMVDSVVATQPSGRGSSRGRGVH